MMLAASPQIAFMRSNVADRPQKMEIEMRKTLFVSIVCAALAASPSLARKHDQTIIVQAQPTELQRWSEAVVEELNSRLRTPYQMFGSLPSSGVTSVRFQRGPDGRPVGATLSRRSGSWQLDRSALRGVQTMQMSQPLPSGMRPDQTFEANILYATSQDEYDQQLKQLQKEAAVRNAWFQPERQVLALNAGSVVSGRSR